ncbi:zinc finger protein [Cinnamomum micranthum f. kanehirae]|uniref:Zinc finger protein n=1 Tax=Cinnamomum micranthum f. kanehirae TaxID=337451 RepID=A0A3S3M3N7_9MAGN|nr:zinc finger protein [Cinnamomum micranthum f. kanehirae]
MISKTERSLPLPLSFDFSSSPAMTNRVLCKFFVHGTCLKGEHCEFSHSWKDQTNNASTFSQEGICSYGSCCGYDHVKASLLQASLLSSSSSNSHVNLTPDPFLVSHPPQIALSYESTLVSSISSELSSLSVPFFPHDNPAWCQDSGYRTISDDERSGDSTFVGPAGRPICAFAAATECPHGEKCLHIHWDLCSTCGKHCLHPYRSDERDEHIKQCLKNKERLEALRHSQELECSVCLDRVLSKATPAERKFGLLSECDHPFCISCIRNWRSNSPSSGMDVNSALRACPICRKVSYYVIPSVNWYSTKEEKQEIVDSYKAKLRYFDFGNGTCPFGSSCFYKHAYFDGSLEEVVLRQLGTEDGSTMIAKDTRFQDFRTRLNR